MACRYSAIVTNNGRTASCQPVAAAGRNKDTPKGESVDHVVIETREHRAVLNCFKFKHAQSFLFQLNGFFCSLTACVFVAEMKVCVRKVLKC